MTATTDFTTPSLNLSSLLADLAASSALLRLQRQSAARPEGGIGIQPATTREARLDAVLRYSMGKLGRICRRDDQDIRHSPFWILLEHRECYETAFETQLLVFEESAAPASRTGAGHPASSIANGGGM
ncbi:MAG: hypothetical protein OEL20_05340 [Sulfuritalea sp.]|nr:hypothetical protein [Sulfuritalea sp.]